MVTERQKEILGGVIEEYIDSAQPVSSKFLEIEYDFGICPASIRIEMQKLTDDGYLYQPHTSAGRVPTDKGYRFFVDDLLERELKGFKKELEIEDWETLKEPLMTTQVITKGVAGACSGLVISYLLNKKISWKEGWEGIFQEPEFKEAGFASKFIQMIDQFENNVEDMVFDLKEEVRVYIGKENPFPKSQDFSIIVSRLSLPKKEQGIVAILGPKRMTYQKNINLINSLTRLLEKL
jgi:transcriptional regulator of heat shock response|tara:strand:+ start:23730 stop:24437 length:708 start_codon:yes stop_codon:yes gene_type:complete